MLVTVFGIVQFLTASTFFGSVSIPFAETMCPRYAIFNLQNANFKLCKMPFVAGYNYFVMSEACASVGELL